MKQIISIIIPCLNDEQNLKNLLKQLENLDSAIVEIIVVDGDSKDDSVKIAHDYAVVLIKSAKGRAQQQNAGAAKASGGHLWFLHADSKLGSKRLEAYLTAIAEHDWGRFKVKLSGKKPIFRVIEWFMNKRSCLSQIGTGDQGIFVTKDLFNRVGGFPQQKLMEDIEICKRLKKHSRISCIDHLQIETSSRKWQEEGVWNTIFLMWKLRFLYFIGTSPDELANKYYN